MLHLEGRKVKIVNSKGEEVKLDNRELKIARAAERRIKNDLGYEVSITTLTTILKQVREQKFFEIQPSIAVPIKVGEAAWSLNITSFNQYYGADDFASGVIKTGSNQSKLDTAEAGVEPVTIPVETWAKQIGWSIAEIQFAERSMNWDIVIAKEKARKKNWDLGIQKLAFTGISELGMTGILNLSGVTVNTAVITERLAGMTPAELNTFVGQVLGVYRANAEYTAWPTHFIIPESDYTGLASVTDPSFPIKTKLQLLLEAFRLITKNDNFQIIGVPYASALGGKEVYVLYNYDLESVRMDVPVPYSNTVANTLNGFQFNNVGYGQFTGVNAYRPKEMIRFEFNTPTP